MTTDQNTKECRDAYTDAVHTSVAIFGATGLGDDRAFQAMILADDVRECDDSRAAWEIVARLDALHREIFEKATR